MADRAISPKSKGHFTGSLVLRDTDGSLRILDVESHLEMDVAVCLSMRPNIIKLENQVRFDWPDDEDDKTRKHFFDFLATLVDGTRVAIVVKPEKKLNDIEFISTVRTIARHMQCDFADRLAVMTERSFDRIELHNATFLDGLKEVNREADDCLRQIVETLKGAVTIRDLIQATGLGELGFRTVGRLLKNGDLRLANHERISHQTYVMAGYRNA